MARRSALYAGALSARGYPVRVLPDLGSRELVEPALMTGARVRRALLVSAAFGVSELTPGRRAGDQASTWLLRQLAAVRTPGLTGPANWVSTTGSTWHPAIGVAVELLLVVFRRWRHLLVFTLCLVLLEIAAGLIYDALSRPRPYGVPIGLESSAGSTPLRLTVEGNPGQYLFGKLYTLGGVLDTGHLCQLSATASRPSVRCGVLALVGCRVRAWVLRGRQRACAVS
jgi:hypothetical protein